MNAKKILSRMFVALAVLMLACCGPNDNPVRPSLDVETSNLIMSVGQSVDRPATTKSTDFGIVYSSTNPSVATVNQNGTVTALSAGRAIIKVYMPETLSGDYTTVSREYHVLVKNVSAVELKNVDKATPLTLVAVEDGIITVTFNGGITLSNDIHYTINAGDELTISKNTSGAFDIVVKKGDVVALYSLNNSLGGSSVAAARAITRAADSGAKYINIRPSMETEIFGNVMSLLKGKDAFADADAIEANNAFYGLFAGADKLVNSEERSLVLPATTLKEGCYQDMFSGCKGIEKAPELPAPTLEKECYKGMFADCSKLSSVTILATQTAEGCIDNMLTNAGTEADTPPVVILNENADKTYFDAQIPDHISIGVAVSSITLNRNELTLMPSETAKLIATLDPYDATDKNVEWSSSNKSVATISPEGLTDRLEAVVNAVSAGTTTITVSTPDGSVSASCILTVEEELTYQKIWVYGEDPTTEAPFQPAAWNSAAMRFSNTEGEHFRTLTDDEYFDHRTLIFDVSDVSDDINVKVMNGWWSATYFDNIILENGLNKITITEQMAQECAKGGDGKDLVLMLLNGRCTINAVYYEIGVEEEPIIMAESVSVEPEVTLYYDADLKSGNSIQLEAYVMPENATKKLVRWKSMDNQLVGVNNKGEVTARGVGLAKVVATTGDGSNKSAGCTVTVKPVGGIWFEEKEIETYPGEQTFTNSITKAGSSVSSVTYASSNENIATVNSSGVVTISPNATIGQTVVITATATVTATEDNEFYYPEYKKTASFTVKIVAPTGQGDREGYTPGTW